MPDMDWVQSNITLQSRSANPLFVSVSNSGILDDDFYRYAHDFFDAGEETTRYLLEVAGFKHDIAKLDTWYFAMIYLYRQSLELLLKACVFHIVSSETDRRNIIGRVRHDLKRAFDEIRNRICLDESSGNGQWLSKFLADISSIDNASDMFRYPFGNNMEILFEEQTDVSLIDTYKNMNRAFRTIENIYVMGIIPGNSFDSAAPKLIVEGGTYYTRSVLGYQYSRHSFYPYFTGYVEVASNLGEIIVAENRLELFMPMCYVFRNAVELGLKRLIVEDSHLGRDDALKNIRENKHNVLKLWKTMKSEISEYANAPESDTSITDTEAYINCLHTFDGSSDKFRYPCDKHLNLHFQTPRKMDVKNIISFFNGLCNFLDGVDGVLGQVREFEAEMRAQYEADLSSYW